MNTAEILAAFLKDRNKTSISEKQRAWLIRQAQQDKLLDADLDIIYLPDAQYRIKEARRMASGGSYVGHRTVPGRYVLEKLYVIRFTNAPYCVEVTIPENLDFYKRENQPFEILNPRTKLPVKP